MKTSKILFFILGALVFSLAACNASNDNSGESHEPTSSHEHTYSSSWNYDNTFHWHDATCGHDVVNNKERHTFNDVVTDPTYSAGGYTTHTCTICGYSYTDSQTYRLSYSITWKNWDDSILRVDQCYEGSTPYFGSNPTRNNDDEHYYVFIGWSPSVVAAYSDATYIAQYSQHERTSFTVLYNSNGGDITPSSQTKTKGQTLTLTSTQPTKEGHTFIGWNNIYENKVYSSGSSFNLDKDVTLWALWEDTCEHCNGTGTYSWTSTCSFCSGTGKRNQCNSCGSYSIKTVIINGIGGIKQCNSCNSTSISTKTCTWCNGKGSSSGSESCTYCNHTGHHGGDAPTASLVEARKIILSTVSGYEYSMDKNNWQSSSVFDSLKPSTSYTFYQRRATSGNVPFGETSKPLTVSTSSTTFFYVTYILNGGTNNSSNPNSYYSNQSNRTLYKPSKVHYSFVNWTYNGSAITEINASWATDIELVANWIAYGYSITYYLDGGTNNVNNPSTHGIETEQIHLQAPTKNGYTFIGWTGSNGSSPELDVIIPAGNTQDLTYTANWSLNTYSISYDLNGGTNNPSNPTSYTVLDSNIVLANPSREHYDFVGWKNGSSSISTIYTSNAMNYNLTACWTPHNYSITYNLNGGTNNENNPTTHTVESNEIVLGNPSKNGYTFTGWTGFNGDTPAADVTIGAGNTENLTYTANWSLDTYSITYVLDGGTNHIKNPSSYTIEDTIVLKDASKDYYRFDGWYKESSFINKVETLQGQFGDLTLYAKFTPFTYSATFSDLDYIYYNISLIYWNGSEYNKTLTYHVGESFDLHSLDMPTRSGYFFGGWFLDPDFENPVNSEQCFYTDTTLYAKWYERRNLDTNEFELTKDLSYSVSGSGSSYSATSNSKTVSRYFYVPYTYESEVSITYSARADGTDKYKVGSGKAYLYDETEKTYIFSVSKSGSRSSVSNTITTTLKAGHYYHAYCYGYGYSYKNSSASSGYFTASGSGSIKITGVAKRSQTSTFSNVVSEKYDCGISSPSASKQGYDFAGWYDENGLLMTDSWNYTSDQTFHAEWSIHNYSVNYVLNGGVNNPSNPLSYNLNDSITLNNPTREGYSFAGWYSDASFTNRIEIINGTDYCDYTLYAKWTPNSYTATLDYNGGQNCPTVNFYSQGNLIRTVDLYKDSTLDYFVPESPSSNLKFGGWYTDSSCNNLYSFNGIVNSNLNLYAKWVDVSYYQYTPLGNSVDVEIDGNQYNYIAIVSPVNQTITITSSSGLDLYGAVYDSNWNVIASSDDISDDNLDFSMTVNLQAGKVYYIAYKANQVATKGDCNISITGNNIISSHITGDYTEIVESITVVYDSSFSLPTPKKDGYIFVGWFDENGNPIDASSWNYSENKTIYAHWIPAN